MSVSGATLRGPRDFGSGYSIRTTALHLFAAIRVVAAVACVATSVLGAQSAPRARVQPPPSQAPQWYAQFYVENDAKAGTDQAYTNGLRMKFGRSAWAPVWGRLLSNHAVCADATTAEDSCLLLSTTFALSQHMYTPRDLVPSVPIAGDRPYGGWTYVGIAGSAATTRISQTVELNIGVTGPNSLAGATQRQWHAWVGAQRPNGWEHQIGTHLGAAAVYDFKYRWIDVPRRDDASPEAKLRLFDVIPHAGATVGNIFTFANAGMTSRLGFNLSPDFGPEYIRPAILKLSSEAANERRPLIEAYGFVHADGRAVGRNIFVDENRDSYAIRRAPLVADLSWGIVVRVCRVALNYRRVLRTSEFRPAIGDHRFDAVSVALTPRCR